VVADTIKKAWQNSGGLKVKLYIVLSFYDEGVGKSYYPQCLELSSMNASDMCECLCAAVSDCAGYWTSIKEVKGYYCDSIYSVDSVLSFALEQQTQQTSTRICCIGAGAICKNNATDHISKRLNRAHALTSALNGNASLHLEYCNRPCVVNDVAMYFAGQTVQFENPTNLRFIYLKQELKGDMFPIALYNHQIKTAINAIPVCFDFGIDTSVSTSDVKYWLSKIWLMSGYNESKLEKLAFVKMFE
jgi:hypothetical protein